MGTPKFAIPSLEKLRTSNHQIELVVSSPDKERGRGRKLSPTPVKEYAFQKGLNVITPQTLTDKSFIEQLKEINADLFIIVAFRILPKEVFTIPKKGSFNLHGSLLPKYRGAAPIQWAIINGEKETGVTTFFLEEKVDTGNIILQEKLFIDDNDDFGSLHDKMMMLGADVVLKTVEMIEKNNFILTNQNNSLACPAPKITKEICRIDWNKPAEQIHNLIRGLSPYPGAYFELAGKIYKIFRTKIVEDNSLISNSEFSTGRITIEDGQPIAGNILQTKNEIYIKTGNGILQILELQPEGRKRITSEEFLRGYTLRSN